MSEHKDIWVFSENYDLMLELLAAGNQLAEGHGPKLAAVLVGSGIEEKAHELIKYGANKVFAVDYPKLKDFQIERYLSILTSLTKKNKPEILLIGSTKNGKELASRLAAKLETGCTPDCSTIVIDEKGKLLTKRIVYSGNAIVTATYLRKPQIATIPHRAFEKQEPREMEGEIIKVEVTVEEPQVELVGINRMEVADVRIEDARIAVCGGRGIKKKEDFKPLQELAQLLGGQTSNTRPLAEDRKWFSGWVGLSGKKIKPTVYIGCGISGMIQHIAGMRDSQVVVAVNKDPEAPIFEVADYIIVGNLYEIVPAIVEALRKALKN